MSATDGCSLEQLPARCPPSRIGFVKHILEGYDGMVILSTVDRQTGELVLRYHFSRHDELVSLLVSLGVETSSSSV